MEKRSRTFVVKLWKETEDYDTDSIIRNIGDNSEYVGILHDKDVRTKEHYHFVCHCRYQMTPSAFRTNIGIPADCHLEAYNIEICASRDDAFRYLIHLGQPDKYQYPMSEVFYNSSTWYTKFQNACMNTSSFVAEADIVNDILDNIENGSIGSVISLFRFCNNKGYGDTLKSYQFMFTNAIKEVKRLL